MVHISPGPAIERDKVVEDNNGACARAECEGLHTLVSLHSTLLDDVGNYMLGSDVVPGHVEGVVSISLSINTVLCLWWRGV
jgi:hypothetical protein